MNLVVDASFVVAALVDSGPVGRWAQELLFSRPLAAPQHMPVEVANILRRSELAGIVTADSAALAHGDLLDLSVTVFPYAPFGRRVWDLRLNLTAYDAWYVAIAESIPAPLATVDFKLAAAAGPRCEFLVPHT